MRKILLIAAIFFSCVSANAQFWINQDFSIDFTESIRVQDTTYLNGSVIFLETDPVRDNTQGRILVEDSVSGRVEYRDVSTIGSGSTDLSFSGASSPVQLNSSTGTDVTITAGGINTFSQAANNLTITATEVDGSVSNEIQNLSYDAANREVDISLGGTSATIPLALADGATEGLASFTAADFDVTSGNVSLDYTTLGGIYLKLDQTTPQTVSNGAPIFQRNGIGTTRTDAIVIQNATAAALGSQQISGSLRLRGYAWETTGGTSQPIDFNIDILPVQGTTASGNLRFKTSIDGVTYTDRFLLNSSGQAALGGSLAVGTTGFVSNVLAKLSVIGSEGTTDAIGLQVKGDYTLSGYNHHAFKVNSDHYLDANMAVAAIYANISTQGAENLDHIVGLQCINTHASSGTLNNHYSGYFGSVNNGGVTTNNYGLYVVNPTGTGSITTNYAVYLESQTKGTTNWGFYSSGTTTKTYFNGPTLQDENMAINTGTTHTYPTVSLHVRNKSSENATVRIHQNGQNYWDLVSPTASTSFQIRDVDGVDYFTIDQTGRVGLTQSTPTAYLHIKAGGSGASNAPLKFTTGTVNATAEAGAMEYATPQLFFTNGRAVRQEIPQIQQARVSTQYDNTTTTLGNVTGLTANVAASGTYRFTATLYTTSDVAGGVKVAIGGTATATSIRYEVLITDAGLTTQGRQTALAGATGVTAVTVAFVKIEGLIVVNAAGTLTVQAAANAAVGTTSVLTGSTFVLTEML